MKFELSSQGNGKQIEQTLLNHFNANVNSRAFGVIKGISTAMYVPFSWKSGMVA